MQSNLTISEPFERCVYQRSNNGFAAIPVAGTVAPGIANVVANLVSMKGGASVVQSIPVDVNGNFGGSIFALGGWYSLLITAGDLQAKVGRVGAGEVFAVFGHSFANGGHDESHQAPAHDERVIALQDTLSAAQFKYAMLTERVGPFHDKPDWIAQFGDRIAAMLDVPVLVYGCAYGGSNLKQNLAVIDGLPLPGNPPGYAGPQSRQPFAPLEKTFDTYIPKTGIRALLFEHGYNDRGTDRTTYLAQLKRFFEYVRSHWNKPELAVIMVQEQLSAVPNTLYDIPTAQAQADYIATGENVYKGPDFNGPEWNGLFSQHDHLFGAAMDLYAKQFADAVTASFLKDSTAYTASVLPDVFPVVLYSAPKTDIKTVDWLILSLLAICLFMVLVYHRKIYLWAFLLLTLIALGRLNGKI